MPGPIYLVLLLFLVACEDQADLPLNKRVEEAKVVGVSALLSAMVSSEIDEFASPRSLNGYTAPESIDFAKQAPNADPVFTFVPPKGIEANYSTTPLLATSGTIAEKSARCASLTYQKTLPSMADVHAFASAQQGSGLMVVNFCIRLTHATFKEEQAYALTPSIKILRELTTAVAELPAPVVTPTTAAPVTADPKLDSLLLNTGNTYTRLTEVTLSLTASQATSMYITNTPACQGGGTWEDLAASKAWTIVPKSAASGGTAAVYAKVKNAAGTESSCTSANITYDADPPSSPSLTINAGAAYTASANVSLSLAATDMSGLLMYVTNTSGCETGGSWEAFATSKSWTLGQTNATATVYAQFKDAAGNTTSCLSTTITHDAAPPESTGVSINNGAAYTTTTSVSLSLMATDAHPVSMYVTNSSGCTTGGSWETLASSKSWTLAQTNATATVYAAFRDVAGNTTSCLSATITHDTSAPTSTGLSINSGLAYTTTTAVSLSLAATDTNPVSMYITNTSGCSADGNWEAFASSKSWNLAQTNATATVYAAFKDAAGNTTSCLSATITHDAIVPTSTSLSINSNATYTTTTSVSLSLAATDTNPVSMYITNTSGCSADGNWEAFASSRSWTLGQTNATATVYAAFKDAAGNTTSCLSASIIHDNQAPSGGSISISSGDSATSSSTVSLGLSATDANSMYITNTSACTADGTWEPYATGRANWALAQTNATATVYVKFKDLAGNESSCVSDSIVHDALAPNPPTSFVDGSSALSPSQSPAATWVAGSDSGSGLAGYQMAIGTSPGDTSILTWTDVGNVTKASLGSLTLSPGTTYYACIRSVDQAGNPSTVVNGDGFILGWYHEAFIKPAKTIAGMYGRNGISLDNDTLVVPLLWENSNITTIINGTGVSTDTSLLQAGAVYVYRRTGSTWAQEAFLKPSATGSQWMFGASVAVSGDTIAVGQTNNAYTQTTIINGTGATAGPQTGGVGAVYIYQRSASSWQQEAVLKTSNAGLDDHFGSALSLHQNTVAVYAPDEDSNETTITNGTSASADDSALGTGAYYIFARSGTLWSQQAYIKESNANAASGNAASLSLHGETLVVGRPLESSNQTSISNGTTASTDTSASEAGATYVYRRTGTAWAQEAYIKAANAEAGDNFGMSVSISGDTLVSGADKEDSNQVTITNGTTASTNNNAGVSGAAYVYTRSAVSWEQQAYLKPVGSSAYFGVASAIDGDQLVVGSYYDTSGITTIINSTAISLSGSISSSGAAYVFKRTGTSWNYNAYLTAPNRGSGDEFAERLAISGNTIAAIARQEDSDQTTISNGPTASSDDSSSNAGAVYIFRRP